jgi:hypothetical protein
MKSRSLGKHTPIEVVDQHKAASFARSVSATWQLPTVCIRQLAAKTTL